MNLGDSVVSSGTVRIHKRHQFKCLGKLRDYAAEYTGSATKAYKAIMSARSLQSALDSLGFEVAEEQDFLVIKANATRLLESSLNLDEHCGKFFCALCHYVESGGLLTVDYYEYRVRSDVRLTIKFENQRTSMERSIIEMDDNGAATLRPVKPTDDRNYYGGD